MNIPFEPQPPESGQAAPDTAKSGSTMLVDRAEVKRTLQVFLPKGQITEVRVLDAVDKPRQKPRVMRGFFDDPDRLIEELSSLVDAFGIYFVPNPVDPELLARCPNRLRAGVSGGSTKDRDVLSRQWLLIDLDPVRASGVSATPAEHEAARVRMVIIARVLHEDLGWPEPIKADSGNGFHLMFRIDLPTKDSGLVKRVLQGLAALFDTDAVHVDTSTCNAARIWKLYGTKAGKGEHSASRPHRLAQLLTVPPQLDVVTTDQLKQLATPERVSDPPASTEPMTRRDQSVGTLSLDVWIREHDLDVDGPQPWEGGRKWIFPVCPWNADHTNRSAYLLELPNGAIAAGCHHHGCQDKNWHALRDVVEPGWRKRKESTLSQPNFATQDDAWEPPTPFQEHELPAFPVDALPDWLRAFVIAEASATQTPPDVAGMLALSACAMAVAPAAVIQVRSDWIEQLNLYTMSVQPPGTRKSAVFAHVTKVIRDVERERAQASREKIAVAETEYRILADRVAQAEKHAAQADENDRAAKLAEARQLAEQLSSFHVPPSPRLVVDDVTPERLLSLMAEQGGCIALLSAEGDVVDMMGGKYSSNGHANFEIYLKAHVGDSMSSDRVNRPSDFVAHPTLTIAVTVQPQVLRELMKQQGFRGRGLHARFLYAVPEDLLGRRNMRAAPMPHEVRESFERKLRQLLDLEPEVDKYRHAHRHVIPCDLSAREHLLDFGQWLEPMLGPFGVLRGMSDWVGKLAGATARIAAILQLAETVGQAEPWKEGIWPAVMDNAIRLAGYLLAHARVAYMEAEADPQVEDARYVLHFIQRKHALEFSVREAYEWTKARFKHVADLEPTLALLAAHRFIRQVSDGTHPGRGRKDSPVYAVNPHWINGVKELVERDAASLDLSWVNGMSDFPWYAHRDEDDDLDLAA